MTSVFVLEHAVRHEGSHIIDVYGTWEAVLYGVSQHYPVPTNDIESLLTVEEASDDMPKEWATPNFGYGDDTWLRVTERTVQTATKATVEVRVRYMNLLGSACDETFRSSDTISDESHATALAEGWNNVRPWGMPDDAEFYVKVSA